ncbi:MAG: zinc-dependent peptidase [Acidimicrobiia bacterium]
MLFRRRRGRGATLPADWATVVDRSVAHWRLLDDAERARLGELMAAFAATRRWEAARGFALDDTVRTVVSAQAALLVLGLDLDLLRHADPIVVHGGTMDMRGTRPGPATGTVTRGPHPIVGQANDRGPILLSWPEVRRNARHPAAGQDVVLHEMAHALDMLDGLVDGTPPLPDEPTRRRWVRVCTRELRRVRAGVAGPLRDYAATGPGELFAVATETFFCRPAALRDERPELYDLLRDYYGQDPAERLERARAGPADR